VTAWAEDPELLDTFRAEVEERLGALQTGLLSLESTGAPKHTVAALFRDAHTVKGSARMMGLTPVLRVAHAMEDLLGALRDGRLGVTTGLVDALLGACDVIARCLPGEPGADVEPVLAALADLLSGREPAAAVHVPAQPRMPAADRPVPAPAPHAPAPPAPAPPAAALPAVERPAGTVAEVRPPAELAVSPSGRDEQAARRSDSVRVAAGKVYDLLDVVGEADLGARRIEQTTGHLLVLEREQERGMSALQAALTRSGERLSGEVAAALARVVGAGDQLAATVRTLRELAEGHRGGIAQVRDEAMGLAMVPMRRVFATLPRVVREVAHATGTDVRLDTCGEDVEIDKQVLDGIADALTHLVVNAVDHGREPVEVRTAAGKDPQLVVRVSARGVAGTVVLEVSDDGAGIDEDRVRERAISTGLLPAGSTLSGTALTALLFAPSFSTAPRVTEVSGRGVGLDVVRDAVDALGGSVELISELGVGTRFTLVLPVTLGVLRCLLARVGDERYAVPVPGVVESVSLREGQGGAGVGTLAGLPVLLRQGASVPLLDLAVCLGLPASEAPRAALVVRHGSTNAPPLAWAVDRLEGETELVVKDLGEFLGKVPGIAGATIDADGSVVCLLDLRELAERVQPTGGPRPAPDRFAAPARPAGAGAARVPGTVRTPPRVLVVEDSVGVRELERVILEGAGYLVETAVDGLDGASRLSATPPDVVVSDVEMPGLDGFELTRTIRRTRGWENVPVIIMTSRGDETARQSGLAAGCSAYLLKDEFDQEELVSTVRRLVGR